MELFNLLETGLPVLGQTFDVSLNWIGRLIRWLCNVVGTVGVGIILFSLLLKLITLPFDIVQRITMRKQNIQMKSNKEKMEKLQKQYANDKEKYNQKVMEMYKENGFSVFSSCLPMILSLVIFIVAINAFNAYAQYSNVENYNTMVDAYNAEMKKNCAVLTEADYENMVTIADGENYTYTVKDSKTGSYVYYKVVLPKAEHDALNDKTVAEKIAVIDDAAKTYYVDVERAVAEDEEIKAFVESYMQVEENKDETTETAVKAALREKARNAVVEVYEQEVKSKTSFLWIKNIWVVDASYKHPVLSASDFASEAEREEFEVNGEKVDYGDIDKYTNAYTEVSYEDVTAKLSEQREQANGYFILILLSIGTILLQQFIMMRSQKEQQKYSSVDGMAGSQQKMTMIIMTGMFAIFSFLYSSAFSIYMVTSNLFSMLSTIVINRFVDRKVEKKETEASMAKMKNPTLERIERAKNSGKQSAEQKRNKK